MKRILFFLPNLNGGGAERALVNLLRHWKSELGNEFSPILAVREWSGAYVHEVPKWIDRRVLGLPATGIWSSFQTAYRLAAVIRHDDVDAVVSFLSGPSTIIASKLNGRRTRIALSVQNPILAFSQDTTYFGRFPKRLAHKLFNFISFRMADFLLPISKGIRNELIASGYARPPQVILVPNSVDIELIQRKIGEEIPAYCVVKDSSVQTIVVAARLVSQKKIDVLIHAMKLIQNQGSARLLILGEGPERPSLERLVSELGLNHLVFFLGFQQNPWKYFACADLFVLPSRYEGFGNVIIEAMACGVPVIATDAPFGPRDIITNGENGLLVPVGDTAALASAIRMVLSDSNCRRNFIRNGMKRSLEYDASRIASVWVQVLRNLTESP